MTSPLTKIWPLPLPEATPRSASRASPGPLTTQPMTATRSGTGQTLQARGDLVGQRVDVDLRPAAGRAGDDLQPALPQPERLQDRDADLDLLDRRRRQRHPDGVADALGQQRAERDRGLDRALERRAGLGHAQVQRVVALLGQLPVGRDHHHRVVVLDRDLDVAEAVLLEQRALPQRRLDQRLGGGLAVLVQQPLVQRAGVDADPDRHPGVARPPWRSRRPCRRTS